MDEPFGVVLRLSLEFFGPRADVLSGPAWRERLHPLAEHECGSRVWRGDTRPTRDEANRVLGQTFAGHPLANLTADRKPDFSKAAHAIVVAEVVLAPELAPIPPGGAFPNVTDAVLSDPYPVLARPWPYAVDTPEGDHASLELLQEVAAGLPPQLWRPVG